MKVTIEPSDGSSAHTNNYATITINHPSDDLDAEEALNVMKRALIAWGYMPENLGFGDD